MNEDIYMDIEAALTQLLMFELRDSLTKDECVLLRHTMLNSIAPLCLKEDE